MLASGLLLVALLSCLTLMVLMSVWRQRKLWGRLPPGPTPLPFIGNYLQLDTEQICDSLMKVPPGARWVEWGGCVCLTSWLGFCGRGLTKLHQSLRKGEF
uniref:Uncharacterized protein n=1 Tax=Equus asinus asinus TaxID=83772 RepID=A0A8C4LBC8_EQUAS